MVSLNQIEHTARKATRGAGLSWGLAEETGRAVRWLHGVGLPGVSSLLTMLDEIDQGTGYAEAARQTLLDSALLADCVSAADFEAASGGSGETLRLEFSFPSPLTLGFVAVAASAGNYVHSLQTKNFSAIIEPEQVVWWGDDWPNAAGIALGVVAARYRLPNPQGAIILRPRTGAGTVGHDEWNALDRYASRTYVPASEASRLAGAGAGLSDND